MSSFIKTMQETLKGTIVGTLSLCFKASNIIEKICWLLMWILGSIYVFIIIADQFETWRLNPTISSRKLIGLSEIEAPAITICHQGNTRMEVTDRLLRAAGTNNKKVKKLQNRFLKHSLEKLLKFESSVHIPPVGPLPSGFSDKERRFEQNPQAIKKIYKKMCHQNSSDSTCQDCLCDHYNTAFSYAKKHNLTIEELYEKIFFDLDEEDNISNGLTMMWTEMKASTGETYEIDQFFDEKSNQWVFLENIDAVFSIVLNSHRKHSLNFGKSITELIRSGNTMEKWKDENWKDPHWDRDHKYWSDKWEQDLVDMMNIFSLPKNQLTLMAISHFYTMNDFGQLGRHDLFTFRNEKSNTKYGLPNEYALGEIPQSFKTCFEQIYEEFSGNVEEKEDKLLGWTKPVDCCIINCAFTMQKHQSRASL